MADRVSWSEQAWGNPWIVATQELPRSGLVVQVWHMNRTVFATYDHQARQWVDVVGTVLNGITHWRVIRE